MKIKFLKAFNGDSILISFSDEDGKPRKILIDGGIGETYKKNRDPRGKPVYGDLKNTVETLRTNGEVIDLLIITHIDDDHIGGILKWFDEDPAAFKLVKKVWFNSGRLIADFFQEAENPELRHFIDPTRKTETSVSQGVEFSKYIQEKRIWDRKIILQGDIIESFGLTFKIISPNKDKLEKLLKGWKKEAPDLSTSTRTNDYRMTLKEHILTDKFTQDVRFPNGSSIAFVLSHNGKNLLFLGDSHPSVAVEGLKQFGFSEDKPLKADLVKLSHHGSKKNTNVELLRFIEADNFVISTNGLSHHHPDKQLLARLINEKPSCSIHFNYEERMNLIFCEQDRTDFPNFSATAIAGEFSF
ncbi:MAG: ComEC/Rec2 family competence protein [Pyrinomonadaceae bacterium]